jgi:hypothetical protein
MPEAAPGEDSSPVDMARQITVRNAGRVVLAGFMLQCGKAPQAFRCLGLGVTRRLWQDL